MIRILGLQRIILLFILLAANIALAFGLFGTMLPQQEKAENDLRRIRAATNARRVEVEKFQSDYDQIKKEKEQFNELSRAGFFSAQDRVQARQILESIQTSSHVLSAKYRISAVAVQDNPIAAESEHVLLQSPVTVNVSALDDVDVFNFIYWVENSFPGNALITGVTMERKIDVDESVLQQIGSGQNMPLMAADINFTWNTFVPRSQSPSAPGVAPATPPGTPPAVNAPN